MILLFKDYFQCKVSGCRILARKSKERFRCGSCDPDEGSLVKENRRGVSPARMQKSAKNYSSNNIGMWERLTLNEALSSLEEGPQPSVENIAHTLLKCTKEKNLAYAVRLHAYIRKNGLEAHGSLGNYLVAMLVEVGSMYNAQEVFDRLVHRNEYSWNSLINGYIICGESRHALTLHQKMQEESLHPSGSTFVALLKACAKLKDLERGREIHAQIDRKGLLERDLYVGSTLVDMYAKFGLLAKAQEVFDRLSVRNVASWTALIRGYAQHERAEEALNCFEQMQLNGVSPNSVTFACSLKACGSTGAIEKGREIHTEISMKGLLKKDIVLCSALVDMYAKCGFLVEAREEFDKLLARDVVSWNALIGGYAKNEHAKEALDCFEQMQLDGFSPDAVTLSCSLKACGSIGAIEKGREIHTEIALKGVLKRDLVLCSALVDMYAKCSLLAEAQEEFDKLLVRDVVSWNALIGGYAKNEHGKEALNCFDQMQLEGVSPNAVTFACCLKACASVGAISKGQELHAEIEKKGLLGTELVGNALVDMYAKCGELAKALEVFDKLPPRNVVSWTALIAGYSQLGESEKVFSIFDRMRGGGGQKPDLITFVSVLNACSQAGLVEKGESYFESMSKDYGITPTLEHYSCMVDLLSRAGQVNRAVAMIKKMPFDPNLVVWHIVLSACRKWGNVEIGRLAFEHIVRLDEKDAAAYVCMSNIYANADMQEDANKVEAMRVKNQAWKIP